MASEPGSVSAIVAVGARLSGTTRVWLYSAALASCAGLLAIAVRGLPHPASRLTIPWWGLVLAFAAAELWVVHVRFGREAHSFSVGEIPLIIGLAFAAPLHVLVARLIGCAIVLRTKRKQAPVKTFFNLSLFSLETCVVLLGYHALAGRPPASGVTDWAAAIAVMVAALLGTFAVIGAIKLHQPGWKPQLRNQILLPAAATFANVSYGLLAVTAISSKGAGAWPLVVVVGVTLLAYRGYTTLREKHESLQLLQRFTRAVGGSLDGGSTSRELLQQTRDLLRAETAEMILIGGDGHALRVSLTGPDAGVLSEETTTAVDPVVATVLREEQSVLASRSERRQDLRRFLHDHALRDAMIVPLKAESTVGTLIVGGRLGDVSTFTADDLRLLETIANHASVLLENGRLVERLRAEVAAKEHQASHDALTGLANRTLFHARISASSQAAIATGRRFAVLLIDLDRFKEINDTLGHHTGDLLLQEVGRRLRQVLEPSALIARLGGDEFAILLPHVADAEAAQAEAQRIRLALERPFQLPDLELFIGASIGIAVHPDHGHDADVLLQRADVAMYAAKSEHRGTEIYTPERDDHSHRRLALVGELRSALENRLLDVHYQPKADLATGRIVGVEALVRWNHPTLGFVPPDEFVPVAERTGMIHQLTELVLEASLTQCRAWRQAGWDLDVAVNLSANTLLSLDLPRELRAQLDRIGLPPSALTLEITESTIMSDPERAITVLNALSKMGIRLSIDDFGTGYSSLSHLKRLPVHQLKIDKSFVLSMTADSNDAVIVRSTIDLGHNLGLHVVAEGVEDQEAWDELAKLGCDLVQGYHLSRPMPAHAVEGWLQRRAADLGSRATRARSLAWSGVRRS